MARLFIFRNNVRSLRDEVFGQEDDDAWHAVRDSESGRVEIRRGPQTMGEKRASPSDSPTYEVAFMPPQSLGLVLEPDPATGNGIVQGVHDDSPGATAEAAIGDVLLALNGETVLDLDFVELTSRIHEGRARRTLTFLRVVDMPLDAYLERLDLANRAGSRDAYGFSRDLRYLASEEAHRTNTAVAAAARDRDWRRYIQSVGGIDGFFDTNGVVPSKLKMLVRRGIPQAIRPAIWARISGAEEARRAAPEGYFEKLLRDAESLPERVRHDIDKDLDRTFPEHWWFASRASDGCQCLRRVLRAFAQHNQSVGYCQSLNFVAATLLLLAEEEDAFWLLRCMVEDLLPRDYYTPSMAGAHTDQLVFAHVMELRMPKVGELLGDHAQHFQLLSLQWFLCLYVNTVPLGTALRIWDNFFLEGGKALFRAGLALLRLHEKEIAASHDASDLFLALRNIGLSHRSLDADALVALAYKSNRVASPKTPRMQMGKRSTRVEEWTGWVPPGLRVPPGAGLVGSDEETEEPQARPFERPPTYFLRSGRDLMSTFSDESEIGEDGEDDDMSIASGFTLGTEDCGAGPPSSAFRSPTSMAKRFTASRRAKDQTVPGARQPVSQFLISASKSPKRLAQAFLSNPPPPNPLSRAKSSPMAPPSPVRYDDDSDDVVSVDETDIDVLNEEGESGDEDAPSRGRELTAGLSASQRMSRNYAGSPRGYRRRMERAKQRMFAKEEDGDNVRDKKTALDRIKQTVKGKSFSSSDIDRWRARFRPQVEAQHEGIRVEREAASAAIAARVSAAAEPPTRPLPSKPPSLECEMRITNDDLPPPRPPAGTIDVLRKSGSDATREEAKEAPAEELKHTMYL